MPFAGYPVWTVCNFHFHNERAKQADVARLGWKMMIADCLKHDVNYISGDANQSLDRGSLDAGLQSALDQHNAGLSDDDVVEAKVYQAVRKDCMVGIVSVSYTHLRAHET